MALIIGVIWDFAWWIIGIGVALCMVVVLFGIIKYSLAQGDPRKAAGARATMFGGAFGVVALPVALIAFRIFFSDVIAPNTGVDASFLEQNCDDFLRVQLEARRNVVTAAHAKGLIAAIQSSKSECAKENWMGNSGAALSGNNRICGLVETPRLGRAKAVMSDGFGRVGGVIVVGFNLAEAKHLTATDNCWIYNPGGGGWHLGSQ